MSQELVFAENFIKFSREMQLHKGFCPIVCQRFNKLHSTTLYASKLSNVLSLFDTTERKIPREQLTGHVTKLLFYSDSRLETLHFSIAAVSILNSHLNRKILRYFSFSGIVEWLIYHMSVYSCVYCWHDLTVLK